MKFHDAMTRAAEIHEKRAAKKNNGGQPMKRKKKPIDRNRIAQLEQVLDDAKSVIAA